MNSRKILKWVLPGLGILVVVSYSVFALEGIVRGPQIEILTPKSVNESRMRYFSYATTTELIEVRGRAINARILMLNDTTIPQNLAGNFSESLLLAPGYNIITLEAKDQYGRTVKKTIEMILLMPKKAEITGATASTTTLINF